MEYDKDIFNELSGVADAKVKVTLPANVKAVFAISNSYELAFDITTTFNPKQNSGMLELKLLSGSLFMPNTYFSGASLRPREFILLGIAVPCNERRGPGSLPGAN
jgi:hypothetical protein